MENRTEKTNGNVTVIQRSNYLWGVVDLEGTEIVPFGKYDWIDGFDSGLARVKVGKQSSNIKNNENKWGIINEQGEEVLSVEYDNIWNFAGKNRFSTKAIKDGIEKEVYFHDLNPSLPQRIAKSNEVRAYYRDDYDDSESEFAGSYAHDVMGYSDDDIYDAFEGDPDNYWNID